MMSDTCVPFIENDIYPQTIDNKTVLVVEVYPGKHRPYSVKGKENSVYIRVNGTSRPADAAALKELQLQGENRSYDCMPEIGAEYDEQEAVDLCNKLKALALDNCEDSSAKTLIKELTIGKLEDIGLLYRNMNTLVPTHAFTLMTNNKYRFAKIQCALFKGNDREIFIDKKEYDGPLYEQLLNAFHFVLNHINLGASIGGLYRKEEYELPPDVIREMISNAVIHRSYLIEEKIQISIYEDRIEVVSPGTLYGGLDFKTIKIGRSKCRNQAIADIFQYMNIVEAWGTGIPRMIKACKKYGLNEPVFEEFGDSFKVTVYRKQANKQINNQTSEQTSKQADKQSDKQINKRTSKHMKDILEYMLDVKEATAKEIAKAVGLSDARTRVILGEMQEIEFIGATNKRIYKLKQSE
ncbi:MAG: putative DNA binding domain-containing protein [Firmicutes bacterium]|nr:putative DNA binding domain-containing protein [Bacillota bacterium]